MPAASARQGGATLRKFPLGFRFPPREGVTGLQTPPSLVFHFGPPTVGWPGKQEIKEVEEAEEDGEGEEKKKKKRRRTSVSRINNATFGDQEEKKCQREKKKKAKMTEGEEKLGDGAATTSVEKQNESRACSRVFHERDKCTKSKYCIKKTKQKTGGKAQKRLKCG